MDHDQFWKHLIHLFPQRLFELFFPDVVPRLDFSRIEWLEQELFPDPPQGEMYRVDIVAKVPTIPSDPAHEHEPEQSLLLIHIETEANMPLVQFDPRMYRYYTILRSKHERSVLPVAIFLNAILAGRGKRQYIEHVWDYQPLVFEYDYIALPGLEAQQYTQHPNILAVALAQLMDMPHEQRVPAAFAAIEAILVSDLDVEGKRTLVKLVETYSPMDESQYRDLNELLTDPKRENAMTFRKHWTDTLREQALEEGKEVGQQEGEIKLLRRLVKAKFPTIAEDHLTAKLTQLPPEQLDQLADRLLTANNLQELGLDG